MATQPNVYAAPFDAVADRYDETFTWSAIGQAQRASVWKELGKAFRAGDRVLEIGCGTGIDACFLAERGVRVVACDSSSRMITVTERRLERGGYAKFVQPLLLPADKISTLQNDELFDGVFSNFGALNCVDEIQKLVVDLAGLLKPGATALLCWIGPCCAWEMAWYLIHGDKKKAFRRLSPDGVTARISDGAFVRVHYPGVKSLVRAFAPEFRLQSTKGIGVAVPPSYAEAWAQRHRRLLSLSERADSFLGRVPGVRLLADHVLLEFQRESQLPATSRS